MAEFKVSRSLETRLWNYLPLPKSAAFGFSSHPTGNPQNSSRPQPVDILPQQPPVTVPTPRRLLFEAEGLR